MLTPEQEKHMQDIVGVLASRLAAKYKAGAEEHGGNIWDLSVYSLLDNALDENIDQATYILTAMMKMKDEVASGGYAPSTVLVKRMNGSDEPLGIHMPKKKGDVGYDLEVSEDTVVPARGGLSGVATTIPCATKISMPEGMWCQILGRSSASNKKGLVVNTAVIDQGYTGPLFANCWNVTDKDILVKKGERIAQVVFFPATTPNLEEVEELPDTERGESGFGSTNG